MSNDEDIHDLYAAFDFLENFQQINILIDIKSPVNNNLLKQVNSEILDHFKSTATTIYHPCGTCRMDKDKITGVVSDKLKLHGIENLWVLDASVFPNITSGNINAPVMMLANISSKLILEDLKTYKK